MSPGPAPVRRRRDFASLSASRRRARSGPVRVVHAPLGADEPSGVEVAYGIGKAVGPAVVRNRLRRRLRVLMRECLTDGRLIQGRYLVTLTPHAVDAGFDDLRRHLGVALDALPPVGDPETARP